MFVFLNLKNDLKRISSEIGTSIIPIKRVLNKVNSPNSILFIWNCVQIMLEIIPNRSAAKKEMKTRIKNILFSVLYWCYRLDSLDNLIDRAS